MVRAAMGLRKALRRVSGPLLALTLGASMTWLEAKRLALHTPGAVDWPTTLASAVLLMMLVARLVVRAVRRHRQAALGVAAPELDVELALLLTAGAMAATTHLEGGLDGPGYVLVYGAIAAVAAFARRGVALAVAGLCVGMEAALGSLGLGRVGAAGFWASSAPAHAAGVIGISFLNAMLLRGRLDQIAARSRVRVEREVERMREQARSFRLHEAPAESAASSASSASEESDKRSRSGVEEIQIAVRFALDLLKRSLGAHTALLLFEVAGQGGKPTLKLVEVATDAARIAEGPFGAGDGVLGAVMRKRAPVNLHGLRDGYRIPYYPQAIGEGIAEHEARVSSLVAVPLVENNHVRGVLCVDRRTNVVDGAPVDRPFSAHDEELVSAAARYVLRAIENERVFGRLERAKSEQAALYAAVQRLSGALTEADVIEAAVESARSIAAFDLAALTIVHEQDGIRTHEVRAVAGAHDFESLVGLRFGDNGGLVAQAVKSRCTLPHRGDHDPQTQVVFTRRHPLRIELHDAPVGRELSEDGEIVGTDGAAQTRVAEVRSVLIVPLTLRDRALGTLVLAARRKGAFRELSLGTGDPARSKDAARTTLEVLASHVATSLANARMFAKLEELATTDGLTGLLNKRVLLELGVQKVRSAARYGKPLSVIQTDIDHFKKVNDTYGHDVGDQVIKGLAGILRRLKRSCDYVARFGGEEFVVICEETDARGARELAERVREELARTTFHASSGPFQVTCSLGVATFGADGTDWDTLYKATDEALYASKRKGRNQTTLASELRAAAKTA
jgi:diguanylate cyclase (GGDEF)-like protein